MRPTFVHRLLVPFLVTLVCAGCGAGGGDTGTRDGGAPDAGSSDAGADGSSLADRFLARVVSDWESVDFSLQAPNGHTDSDGDGEVDADDAVIVVETLRALGRPLPPTVVQGLYEGFYTEDGYAADPASEAGRSDFGYTRASPVAEDDLKAHDWSGLVPGDLVFVDYDQDYLWDTAALYLGERGDVAHAVLHASDYYDRVVVVDLDDADEILILDIAYGWSDVRAIDFDAVAALQ